MLTPISPLTISTQTLQGLAGAALRPPPRPPALAPRLQRLPISMRWVRVNQLETQAHAPHPIDYGSGVDAHEAMIATTKVNMAFELASWRCATRLCKPTSR